MKLPHLIIIALPLFACDDSADPVDDGADAAPPSSATIPCPVPDGAPLNHRDVDLFTLTSAGETRFEGRVEVKGSETNEPGVRVLEELPEGPTLPKIFRLKTSPAAAPEVGATFWATLDADGAGAALLVLSEEASRPPSLIAFRGAEARLSDAFLTSRDINIRPFAFCEPTPGVCYDAVIHRQVVVDLGQGQAAVFAGETMELARAGQVYTVEVEMARGVEGEPRCPDTPADWYELLVYVK